VGVSGVLFISFPDYNSFHLILLFKLFLTIIHIKCYNHLLHTKLYNSRTRYYLVSLYLYSVLIAWLTTLYHHVVLQWNTFPCISSSV
jgi:hypothetical protein